MYADNPSRLEYSVFAWVFVGSLPFNLVALASVRHARSMAIAWHPFAVALFVAFVVWHAAGTGALAGWWLPRWGIAFMIASSLPASIAYQAAMTALCALVIVGDRHRAHSATRVRRSEPAG
ncbi:hypothetical protein V5P93_003683 [Actinokineospora auranticolor]|nr:hypothetical protein [Actinokineospora auranticolor]